MTMVEIMIVLVVLTVSMSMFTSTIVSTAQEGKYKAEMALATDAMRAVVETMRSESFAQVYARYNSNPADDPGGAGTAPGKNFAVQGLDVAPGDPDGFVGEILFPEVQSRLREDVDDVPLGMPRDLNGDGRVDALDHRFDYRILPVHLRVTWKGPGKPHTLDLYSMLVSQ